MKQAADLDVLAPSNETAETESADGGEEKE